MANLTGWEAVAREIGDYDLVSVPGHWQEMEKCEPHHPAGYWLPAEAAAKEILRLREAIETEHQKGLANLMKMADLMNREIAALRELLREVAVSGVEQDLNKYVVVQISAETWRQVQAIAAANSQEASDG